MADWIRWVNAKLPHQIGADPDDGIGIDCLVMCAKVRKDVGLATPLLDPRWFDLAAEGRWPELEAEWNRMCEPCKLEPYAVVLHMQPGGMMGVGIVIDDGVLIVHHRRGAQWLPIDVAARIMQPLNFWRPKNAAI
jgi:hypothetical protein